MSFPILSDNTSSNLVQEKQVLYAIIGAWIRELAPSVELRERIISEFEIIKPFTWGGHRISSAVNVTVFEQFRKRLNNTTYLRRQNTKEFIFIEYLCWMRARTKYKYMFTQTLWRGYCILILLSPNQPEPVCLSYYSSELFQYPLITVNLNQHGWKICFHMQFGSLFSGLFGMKKDLAFFRVAVTLINTQCHLRLRQEYYHCIVSSRSSVG